MVLNKEDQYYKIVIKLQEQNKTINFKCINYDEALAWYLLIEGTIEFSSSQLNTVRFF